MKTYTIIVPTGVAYEFAARGNYIRVKSAPVDCVIYNPDAQGDEKIEASQGDDFQLSDFERLIVSHSSGTTQTYKFQISKDKWSSSSPVSSAVNVSSLPATALAIASTQATVSNAAAVQLLAAKGTRRYLLVQNNDASAWMRLNMGAAATAKNGIRIPPGGSFEMQNYQTSGIVSAMMETATAAANNVQIMEG